MTTTLRPPASAPAPIDKEQGERQRRLRWMAAEVARVQDEVRASRVALDALMVAGRRGPLSLDERTRRRDLQLHMEALRLRLAELRGELEVVRASER